MFKSRLKELRSEKGLLKKEMADILDIHESTYGKYELGHREPDIKTIATLADFFNVTMDYLLGKSEDSRPPESIELSNKLKEEMKGIEFAFADGFSELDDEDRAELIRMKNRMLELKKLKEQAN